jgi:quercetin dioxygenase-like cupin family protein
MITKHYCKSIVRVASLLALTLTACITASATPGSGVTPSNKVVSGNVNIDVVSRNANAAALSQVAAMAGKLLLLQFGSDNAPINILNSTLTFAPGGFSGWHSHGGPGIVIVVQGTISLERTSGCFVDYPQGSVFFEAGPSEIHNAVNRTGSPVIVDAYFFLPAFVPPGGNLRIDQPVQFGPCQ